MVEQHLRSGISEGGLHAVTSIRSAAHDVRKTNIADLGLAVVPGQQHIAALDVSMQHAMRVKEVETLDDVQRDVGPLVVPPQLSSLAAKALQGVPQIPTLHRQPLHEEWRAGHAHVTSL